MYGPNLVRYIYARSARIGIDPAAVLAVAQQEGGFWGAVGDQGTSFGPFQLHEGGALPSSVGNPKVWANSQAGIDYALAQIASATHGAKGLAAIEAQVNQFERPKQQLRAGEIQRAAAAYTGIQGDLRTQRYGNISGTADPRAGGGIGGAITGAITGSIPGAIPGVGGVIGEVPGIGGAVSGAVSGVTKPFTSIYDAFQWIGGNWDRVLEVLGGFALLSIGLFLLGRQVMGKDTNLSQLASGQVSASARDKGYKEGFETGRTYSEEQSARKTQRKSDSRAARMQRSSATRAAYEADIPY